MKWTDDMYMYIPSLWTSLSNPTPLGHHRVLSWAPCTIQLLPTSYLFYMHMRNLEKWYQFSSVAQSCLTLCDPMNCSTPGLPVRHQLLESTQTHVHRVSDAIQPSHPLSSPSPPAANPSQHQKNGIDEPMFKGGTDTAIESWPVDTVGGGRIRRLGLTYNLLFLKATCSLNYLMVVKLLITQSHPDG